VDTPSLDERLRPLVSSDQGNFKDISDFAHDVHAEMPSLEVYEAIKVSQTLSREQGSEPESINTEVLLTLLAAIVATELPERNTVSHTWPWALKHYGWRAVILLAVALDDPRIRDRHKFSGSMVTRWKGEMILEPNLKRLRAQQAAIERAGKARRTVDGLIERNPRFAALARLGMKDAELMAWFSKARIIREDGKLILEQPGKFQAGYLEDHYRQTIGAAAGAGVAVFIKIREPSP
jgi:hypothetical protein